MDKKEKNSSHHLIIQYLGLGKCKVLEADPLFANFFKLEGFYKPPLEKNEGVETPTKIVDKTILPKNFRIKIFSKCKSSYKNANSKSIIIDTKKYVWKSTTITKLGYITFKECEPVIRPTVIFANRHMKPKNFILFYESSETICMLNELDVEYNFKGVSKELSFYRSFFDHVRATTKLTDEMMQLIKDYNDKVDAEAAKEKQIIKAT